MADQYRTDIFSTASYSGLLLSETIKELPNIYRFLNIYFFYSFNYP